MESKLQEIQINIQQVLTQEQRKPNSVRLIGVSKKQPLTKIIQLAELGLRDFGENYVQELVTKQNQLRRTAPTLAKATRWHFIGHLQSNKAKEIVGAVEYIHTVDSIKLAKKISKIAETKKITQKILLEVNLGGEPNKFGFAPKEVTAAAQVIQTLPNLDLKGLMAIPPVVEDIQQSQCYFGELKSLLDECHASGFLKEKNHELSMGMSQDYITALKAGSTMVRIGTALFGPRI